MMKMSNYKYLVMALVFVLATSCDEDINDKSYKGPLVVEFAKGFAGSQGIYIGDNGDTFEDVIVAQLVGPQQGSDVVMNFEVDPSSTAVPGIHYNLLTTGSFTIPAGTSSGEVRFEVMTENFSIGEVFTLTLNITGGDAAVSENYRTITHTLEIACTSDLAGTYNSLMDGDFGDGAGGSGSTYSGLTATVLLTELSPGVYTIDDMSFGLYPQGYGDVPPTGRIQDVCGDATDLGDTDRYGDPFTITANVNPDGTIDLSWSNTWGDTGTGTLTPN